MHLKELFDLPLTQGQDHMRHCPLHHVCNQPTGEERLLLSSGCYDALIVLCLFLTVPWIGLLCVIVSFPDHTHLFGVFVSTAPSTYIVMDISFDIRELFHFRKKTM